MITLIVIGSLMLMYYCMKISFVIFGKMLYYIAIGSVVLGMYLVLFALNVFTVPLWMLMCLVEIATGGKLPYLEQWHSLFYPTYEKVTRPRQRVQWKKPVRMYRRYYWYEDPFYWFY